MHFTKDTLSLMNLSAAPFGASDFGKITGAYLTRIEAAVLAGETGRRAELQALCNAVYRLAGEMALVAGGQLPARRERRRHNTHLRQIAMYICHVTLGLKQVSVGAGFARDRSTVAHACAVVEDRRDDKAYDAFISCLERAAACVFGIVEVPADA